jgi:hypothetical protein
VCERIWMIHDGEQVFVAAILQKKISGKKNGDEKK